MSWPSGALQQVQTILYTVNRKDDYKEITLVASCSSLYDYLLEEHWCSWLVFAVIWVVYEWAFDTSQTSLVCNVYQQLTPEHITQFLYTPPSLPHTPILYPPPSLPHTPIIYPPPSLPHTPISYTPASFGDIDISSAYGVTTLNLERFFCLKVENFRNYQF